MKSYNEKFNDSIQNLNIDEASDLLVDELATIISKDSTEFVDMLNESGVDADYSMSETELIKTFIENLDNKRMILGASLLVNSNNRTVGFDGDDEISDSGVKVGYAVLNETLNTDEIVPVQDEQFSYIAIAALAGLVGKGINKLRKNRRSRGKTERSDARREERRRQAQLRMQRVAAEQKRIQLENAKRKKKTTITLIIVGSVSLLAILGTVIYLKNKK
jgi:hypothetical protein